VSALPLDVVAMNAMDMSDINASRIACTSCKAEEKAVARCTDCASFLCSNCVTAHKYMRCFENHKVGRSVCHSASLLSFNIGYSVCVSWWTITEDILFSEY